MDPISALSIAGISLQLSKSAGEIGFKIYTFVQSAKNVDQTLKAFEQEIKSLETSCTLVSDRVRKIVQEHQKQFGDESSLGSTDEPWKCLEAQVSACAITIADLEKILGSTLDDGTLEKRSFMSKAVKQISINMKSEDIAQVRERIRSHTAALHTVLLCISIEVSYLAPQRADQHLKAQLAELSNKVQQMTLTIQQQSRYQDHAIANEEAILSASSRIIANGETLYEASVFGGSVQGIDDDARIMIHGWVQNVNATNSQPAPTSSEPSMPGLAQTQSLHEYRADGKAARLTDTVRQEENLTSSQDTQANRASPDTAASVSNPITKGATDKSYSRNSSPYQFLTPYFAEWAQSNTFYRKGPWNVSQRQMWIDLYGINPSTDIARSLCIGLDEKAYRTAYEEESKVSSKKKQSRLSQMFRRSRKPEKATTIQGEGYITDLSLAALFGVSKVAKSLINAGVDVNAIGASGLPPLSYAATGGSVTLVECLLEAGAAVNGEPSDAPPLLYTARCGYMDVADTLLSYHADPTKCIEPRRSTPLHQACAYGCVPFVKAFSMGHSGLSQLNSVLLSVYEDALFEGPLLIEGPIRISEVESDSYGIAAMMDQVEVLEYLISRHVDTQRSYEVVKDRFPLGVQVSATTLAAAAGRRRTIQWMIDNNKVHQAIPSIIAAMVSGHEEIASTLFDSHIESSSISARDFLTLSRLADQYDMRSSILKRLRQLKKSSE